jgi:hypothetical protein
VSASASLACVLPPIESRPPYRYAVGECVRVLPCVTSSV